MFRVRALNFLPVLIVHGTAKDAAVVRRAVARSDWDSRTASVRGGGHNDESTAAKKARRRSGSDATGRRPPRVVCTGGDTPLLGLTGVGLRLQRQPKYLPIALPSSRVRLNDATPLWSAASASALYEPLRRAFDSVSCVTEVVLVEMPAAGAAAAGTGATYRAGNVSSRAHADDVELALAQACSVATDLLAARRNDGAATPVHATVDGGDDDGAASGLRTISRARVPLDATPDAIRAALRKRTIVPFDGAAVARAAAGRQRLLVDATFVHTLAAHPLRGVTTRCDPTEITPDRALALAALGELHRDGHRVAARRRNAALGLEAHEATTSASVVTEAVLAQFLAGACVAEPSAALDAQATVHALVKQKLIGRSATRGADARLTLTPLGSRVLAAIHGGGSGAHWKQPACSVGGLMEWHDELAAAHVNVTAETSGSGGGAVSARVASLVARRVAQWLDGIERHGRRDYARLQHMHLPYMPRTSLDELVDFATRFFDGDAAAPRTSPAPVGAPVADAAAKHKPTLTSRAATRAASTRGAKADAARTMGPDEGSAAITLDMSKAGMQTVDKAAVEAVIRAATEGTPYYDNEQRKHALRQQHTAQLLAKRDAYTRRGAKIDVANNEAAADADAANITAARGFGVFAHVDMDAFYAAVEEQRDPRLRSVPVGVGDTTMLATSNYAARRFGVRAGMPGFIAKQLCPQLVFVDAHFDAYNAAAEQVRAVVRRYDADFRSGGLDEVAMSLAGYLCAHGPPRVRALLRRAADKQHGAMAPGPQRAVQHLNAGERLEVLHAAADVVRRIRAEICTATKGLTASAGIAVTPVLAKIASNERKPNGQCTLEHTTHDAIAGYMAPQPIRLVPGVGKTTDAYLSGLGMRTCADVVAQRATLRAIYPRKSYEFLLRGALGASGSALYTTADDVLAVDNDAAPQSSAPARRRGTKPPTKKQPTPSLTTASVSLPPQSPDRRSIGAETGVWRMGPDETIVVAERLLEGALERMRTSQLRCGLVTLKVKHSDFTLHTSSAKVGSPGGAHEARAALRELQPVLEDSAGQLRLVGVRLSKLAACS